MTILLFIFGTIYFGIYAFMNKSISKIANENISVAIKSYSAFPSNPNSTDIKPNELIFFIEDKVLICDETAFNEEQIDALYEKLSAEQEITSIEREGDVFYTITSLNEKKVLIATNMSKNVAIITETRQSLFFSIISIYLVLFVIVYLISFKVFAPIKKALEKQKQFISDASHELKTPITIISASSDALYKSNDKQWIANIKTQTDRMNVLVGDMLTLAKMDENKFTINNETFILSNEITDLALSFDALAFEKSKNLILNISPNIEFTGDKQSVKKIVSILLDNAIKHATVGGEIIVELKKENKLITFSVYNSGSAIKEENVDKLFERFYRGDNSRSRDSGGSGLGLAIAKSICDANKWKINAQCKLNEFMKITVTFNKQKQKNDR